MNEKEQLTFNKLVSKVQQHEETITQLVEIIAATNRRITDLTTDKKENKKYSLT
ncbi:hypothetical protein QGM71_04970 [Virgibacillus sp. C22-A2]|uniref:Degradation enzyme regulation protein DegQ n=1 Tax=Virgibacillus tibetensis TaxID=3042313 RepID=A0ABU6KD65_9BACI|nr:hypothetical protein [Virgibacillus sp. C22-A2]